LAQVQMPKIIHTEPVNPIFLESKDG